MTEHTYPRTDWSTTSFSELSTLSQCEEKWDRKYRLGLPDEAGPALQKGKLVHAGVNMLTEGVSGANILDNTLSAGALMGADPETVDDALWLLKRYREHYSQFMRNVEVLASEVQMDVELPFLINGRHVTLHGYADNLYRINGRVYLVERKTMADWSRLDLIDVDPQVSLYDWAIKQGHVLGHEVYGILFDAIRTYRWALQKPTQKEVIELAQRDGVTWLNAKERTEWARERVARHPGVEAHPPHESFEQLWIDRTYEQHAQALEWARRALLRRDDLTSMEGFGGPVRNIGPFCKKCPYKTGCFDDMAFGGVTITVEP